MVCWSSSSSTPALDNVMRVGPLLSLNKPATTCSIWTLPGDGSAILIPLACWRASFEASLNRSQNAVLSNSFELVGPPIVCRTTFHVGLFTISASGIAYNSVPLSLVPAITPTSCSSTMMGAPLIPWTDLGVREMSRIYLRSSLERGSPTVPLMVTPFKEKGSM